MKKERVFGLFLLALVVFSFAGFFVGAVDSPMSQPATSQQITEAITTMVDSIQAGGKPVFNALLGDTNNGSDLFVKVLYFFVVTLIVMAVLGQVNLFAGKEFIQGALGILVAIIGIRFLPEGMLNALALPSTALVAALVVGGPFLVLGSIIMRISSPLVRRAGWTLYGVTLLVLWFYNITSPWHWIYPAFVLGCIWAFAFDGTLQKFFGRAKAKRTEEIISNVTRDTILGEIRTLESSLAAATTPADIRRIKAEIARKKLAIDGL